MNQNAALIATAIVRPGKEEAFSAWQAKHDTVIAGFSGYVSSDIVPPASGKAEDPWTTILNFKTQAELKSWLQSPERGKILGDLVPLLEGGNFGETIKIGESGETPNAEVNEVIFSKVKPSKAHQYREWAGRIQAAQAKYPGYRGMYLQPPPRGGDGGHWTSILRFDSAGHLEAWMNAPERRALMAETSEFIETEEFLHLATAFPGWVPIDPMTGKGPPNWKAAMLVLLGLFPIVMLEIKYLSPVLATLGLRASLATFIGNAISVVLTSFFTMPWCVNWFGWWLFPKGNSPAISTNGVVIICVLYAIEVVALWWLLPW